LIGPDLINDDSRKFAVLVMAINFSDVF